MVESYSNIPDSKTPTSLKGLILGILPKGVVSPKGEMMDKESFKERPKLLANSWPKMILPDS
jgi:hypothetical protein